MRIGEIAVVGPGFHNKVEFIKMVCDEVVVKTDKLIFGRLQINEQLLIHLYGLDLSDNRINPAWDLVSKKLLGYVVLFNWNNPDSYSTAKSTIDTLSSRYKVPIVIAANLRNGESEIPPQLINIDLNLAEHAELTFCRLTDPASIRNVLVILINSVINTMNQGA